MSAAAATATADAAPKAKGKKKLFIIVGVVLLVLAIGAGGGIYVLKKRAAEAAAAAEAEESGDEVASHAAEKKPAAPTTPPTFLPLEAFVVNLADRDVDRFAQVGITLELEDAKAADAIKLYMPAIRNGVLMILAHKTSAELLERSGKEKLAEEIARATVRPLGIEIAAPEDAASQPVEGKKRKPKAAAEPNPVRHVHFSSFIIQ